MSQKKISLALDKAARLGQRKPAVPEPAAGAVRRLS